MFTAYVLKPLAKNFKTFIISVFMLFLQHYMQKMQLFNHMINAFLQNFCPDKASYNQKLKVKVIFWF